MPSTDPKTGKRISGSKQRAKVKQRETGEAKRQEQRDKAPAATAENVRAPLRYADVPAPNLEDTASLVRYAAQILAVQMDQTLLDPMITEEQRRREIRDGAAKLGMIRDKAAEQEKLDKAEKLANRGKAKKTAGVKPLAGVVKPETAR